MFVRIWVDESDIAPANFEPVPDQKEWGGASWAYPYVGNVEEGRVKTAPYGKFFHENGKNWPIEALNTQPPVEIVVNEKTVRIQRWYNISLNRWQNTIAHEDFFCESYENGGKWHLSIDPLDPERHRCCLPGNEQKLDEFLALAIEVVAFMNNN